VASPPPKRQRRRRGGRRHRVGRRGSANGTAGVDALAIVAAGMPASPQALRPGRAPPATAGTALSRPAATPAAPVAAPTVPAVPHGGTRSRVSPQVECADARVGRPVGSAGSTGPLRTSGSSLRAQAREFHLSAGSHSPGDACSVMGPMRAAPRLGAAAQVSALSEQGSSGPRSRPVVEESSDASKSADMHGKDILVGDRDAMHAA
jgi:hypothetical protein